MVLNKILGVAASQKIHICCFLDGLDEYGGEKDLLLDWIFKLRALNGVKICLSSRPEEAYRNALKQVPQLRLQDLTQNDIRIYIHDRLEVRLPSSSSEHDPRATQSERLSGHDLMHDLWQKASGVFLWVRLVVHDLLQGVEAGETLRQLKQRLEATPVEIRDLYRHMLEKLPRSFKPHSARYLSMLLTAVQDEYILHDTKSPFERFTLLDIVLCDEHIWKEALEFDKGLATNQVFGELCDRLQKNIIYSCAGLVEIADSEHKSSVLQYARPLDFIHQSVIEYLRDEPTTTLGFTTAQSFLLRTRAITVFCFLYFCGCLQELYHSDIADIASDVSMHSNNTSDSQSSNEESTIPTKGDVQGLSAMKAVLFDMALVTETKILGQADGESRLWVDYKETITYLFTLLKNFDPEFWKLSHSWPWTVKGLNLTLSPDDDQDFGVLGIFGIAMCNSVHSRRTNNDAILSRYYCRLCLV